MEEMKSNSGTGWSILNTILGGGALATALGVGIPALVKANDATNAIAVKMYVHNKLGNQLSMLADEKGMIDVDFLEDITKEEMKKLGSIIIPAIGTSYKLNEVDVHNLFAKIREMGDKE